MNQNVRRLIKGSNNPQTGWYVGPTGRVRLISVRIFIFESIKSLQSFLFN